MWKKVIVCVLAVLVVAAAVMFGTREKGKAPQTPLTPEMKKDFGAAMFVPEDASAYCSVMHLAHQWRQVWESNAVQNVVALPFIQQGWAQMQQHPAYLQIMALLETHPLCVQGLPVLEDAVSSEIFVCAGPDLPDFLTAYRRVINTWQMLQFSSAFGGEPDAGPDAEALTDLIDVVLENGDLLRVPSQLLGFKLTDKQAAQRFLDTWVPEIGPTPVGEIVKKSIGGADFYVFKLSGEEIPRTQLDELGDEMVKEGVPEHKAEAFITWIRSQRLVLALGIRGDYLILSIGKDASMLATLGEGKSLAKCEALEPLRSHYKPGLQGISYVSAALSEVMTWTPNGIRVAGETLIAAIPERASTAGLKERLEKDLELLVADLADELPEPSSMLLFAFENKGIESYAFTESEFGLDYSKPLSILTHRGKKPIACSAGRSLADPGAYDTCVKWLKIAFVYFEDYAVPEMAPRARTEYEKAMKLARPFLASVDEATRDYLVPAVDGTQAMIVLDGHGTFAQAPGGERLAAPVPIPRLGIAVELNDAEKFKEAMRRYFGALTTLLRRIESEYKPKVRLALPPPETTGVAGGTLYFYRLPWEAGDDVFPCALLKGRLLILASSSKLAEEMAGTVPMPTCAVTHVDQPAGAAAVFDGAECWSLLRRLTDSVFVLLQANDAFDDLPSAMLIQMHIDTLWRSLGAIRGYRSATTLENGYSVNHSWLHVEDISP